MSLELQQLVQFQAALIDKLQKRIDVDICPNCGSDELVDKKIYKRIVEEIPEPVMPETIAYEIMKKNVIHAVIDLFQKNVIFH